MLQKLLKVTFEISTIKSAIAEQIKNAPDKTTELSSVFIMGSNFDSNSLKKNNYQDIDIHFCFKTIALKLATLEWVKSVFDSIICKSDKNKKIEACIRDRHWKMIPDYSYPINIGIHGTLLNAADHFKRAFLNPILANNMFSRSSILYGEHPAKTWGCKPLTSIDYIHSVGGLSWLGENFTRVVAMHVLYPSDRRFYSFIGGYCWNMASSAMFHLFTLLTHEVTGREQAFSYFISLKNLDKKTREAAEMVYAYKKKPDAELPSPKQIFNATAKVVNFVYEYSIKHKLVPEVKNFTGKTMSHVFHEEKLNFNKVLNLENHELPIIVDYYFSINNEDFYSSVESAIKNLKKTYGNLLSFNEYYEFLADWNTRKATIKLRLWNKISISRRIFSYDFFSDQTGSSITRAIFGWEDGAQALLQRLHESFLKTGFADKNLVFLANLCYAQTMHTLAKISLAVTKPKVGLLSFQQVINNFGQLIAPFIPYRKV